MSYNTLYQHIIIPLQIFDRFEYGFEISEPDECNTSDEKKHIIKCALNSNCVMVITDDNGLEVKGKCNLTIKKMSDFVS